MSGKKQVVWFHACFPASPAASQAACFYFSSIRTGLSCLCRNLSKANAHWLTGKIHSKTILSKTSTLENIFFKTVFFPFAKPVPFQHQYQTKTLRICQLNILLSAPAALWPWPKFYQGPPCVSCTLAVAPWPCLHPAGLLLMVLRW